MNVRFKKKCFSCREQLLTGTDVRNISYRTHLMYKVQCHIIVPSPVKVTQHLSIGKIFSSFRKVSSSFEPTFFVYQENNVLKLCINVVVIMT